MSEAAITGPLAELGVSVPVLAAPMAGGASTPDLVLAAARSGGLGFLAAGYQSPHALGEQIEAVRRQTPTFGVNLFAPPPVPVDRAAYARYRDLLLPEADRLGVVLPEVPVEDDDHWRDKVDLLVDAQVPLVSFTFGIPDAAVVTALHAAGSVLAQTVTSAEEAVRAAAAGLDVLVVQGSGAGGHSATLTPERVPAARPLPDLVAEVRGAVGLPLVGTGGLASPDDVAGTLRAGADAAMVGTVLLLAPESGTSAVHRAALGDPSRGDTVVTRAFTGRPARALPNAFIETYDREAPAGYPALHHLTSPLRRASAAAGDPEGVHLWAGTGYREAADQPALTILGGLATRL
jgi:NAD(P)H-dependent flavin oxidoreductase YrpB (nitropropane dioxygenase family)